MSPLRRVSNRLGEAARARSDSSAPSTSSTSSPPGPPVSPEQFVAHHDALVDQIYSYAARRLGRDLAEDITAETFALAWAGLASFDPSRGTFASWLFGIETNLIRRHHRQEERRWRAYARTGADPLADPTRPDEQRVLERLTASDDWPRVAGALASLSPDDRSMLLLSAWHEVPYQDIATIFDLPVGTVKSRLSRARKRISADSAVGPSREPTDD